MLVHILTLPCANELYNSYSKYFLLLFQQCLLQVTSLTEIRKEKGSDYVKEKGEIFTYKQINKDESS